MFYSNDEELPRTRSGSSVPGQLLSAEELGRVSNIMPLSFILNLCRPADKRIGIRAQAVMSFAGLRGAIAFARRMAALHEGALAASW